MVKSATTKTPSGKRGGAGITDATLIPGGLSGRRSNPTAVAERRRWTGQESAAAIVPAGIEIAGRGQTSVRGDDAGALAIGASTAAIPRLSWACIRGRAVTPPRLGAECSADPASRVTTPHPARSDDLWKTFLCRDNLVRALRRVEANRGAPGPGGMPVDQLRPHLKAAWPEIRAALDAGTYRPAPVRRVTIPKPGGGERELGVPTVTDRFLQQALSQVLSPIFEPHFSDRSFGFRPGRSAHQAVDAARRAIEAGRTWVVGVDLDRFFDRVQHDALMARLARRVGDRRIPKLSRRYLDAGVLVESVKVATAEGIPQGSPLSPLLANIMLDDLDAERERRGHAFVRYADDLRVYVASERAATRVLAGCHGLRGATAPPPGESGEERRRSRDGPGPSRLRLSQARREGEG
jgi:retron-type reverse transcriptase